MHIRVLLSRYRSYRECPSCHGARLKDEALGWRLGSSTNASAGCELDDRFVPATANYATEVANKLPGLTVHDVMLLPLESAERFFGSIELPAPIDEATDLLLTEIRGRLRYLREVGLGYLTLDRQSRTLSGGEVQRINLTTALGTSLVNTLFVLDEPSIGLHARDMARVVEVLRRLRDAGNSLLVVEHDETIMHAADRIIDMGPGPGEAGGQVVFNGPPSALLKRDDSLTAQYLKRTVRIDQQRKQRQVSQRHPRVKVTGAAENNLANVTVSFPLGRLVCVTGVSGSGKSTLVEDILYRGIRKALGQPTEAPGNHKRISGAQHIDDVMLVDQSPIGKSARSCPASYVGCFDAIRKLFAD